MKVVTLPAFFIIQICYKKMTKKEGKGRVKPKGTKLFANNIHRYIPKLKPN